MLWLGALFPFGRGRRTRCCQAEPHVMFFGGGSAFLLRWVVPDCLDVVAVRVVDESCVVAGGIVAVARRAVVLAAGRNGGFVECLHPLFAVGFKSNVQGYDSL